MSTFVTDNLRSLDGTVSIPVKGIVAVGNNSASNVSVTPAGNLGAGNVQAALVEHQGDIDTLGTNKLDKAGGVLTGTLGYAPEVEIASANPALAAAASNNILITGGTNITTFGNLSAGQVRILKFQGSTPNLYLKNSTALRLPGNADIQVAAGDVAVMRSMGSGNWECLFYQRAASGPNQSASIPVQSEFIFYRNTKDALIGTQDGGNFQWPGTALTANTFKMYIQHMVGKQIKFAAWRVVWNPSTVNGGGTTAIRLVNFDDGPSNIVEMARFDSPAGGYNSPRVETVNVTTALQNAINGGIEKQFGHQTAGTGSSGCLIYGSWLDVVW